MINNIKEYIRLMRLHQPTGFLLLFWPCSFGILLTKNNSFPWKTILLFLFGSVIMRSAGCIINDIIDKDLDKHVERTRSRPLASGTILLTQAILVIAVLLLIGAFILFSLTKTAIYLGLISILLIVTYPFMKRISNYPQVFLALTFNIGALIGYAAITDKISFSATLLYIACWFWTIGYDTIYGYQDTKYDKKIGVKSTALKFEKHAKIFIFSNYALMALLLLITIHINSYSWQSYIIWCFVTLHLIWQTYFFDKNSSKICMNLFKKNGSLGLLIFFIFLFK